MGEAKRRKKLDPDYGKNLTDDFSLTFQNWYLVMIFHQEKSQLLAKGVQYLPSNLLTNVERKELMDQSQYYENLEIHHSNGLVSIKLHSPTSSIKIVDQIHEIIKDKISKEDFLQHLEKGEKILVPYHPDSL